MQSTEGGLGSGLELVLVLWLGLGLGLVYTACYATSYPGSSLPPSRTRRAKRRIREGGSEEPGYEVACYERTELIN